MKLYKLWIKATGTLAFNGAPARISAWGGSNSSLDEARTRALEKLAAVQERVAHGVRFADASYEAEIREEIIQTIDTHNIVSRNRYGALVLNSEDTLFIDIDEPPFMFNLLQWFKELISGKHTRKERIIQMVEKRAAAYPDLEFRVYETHKGVRILVTGRSFSARAPETKRMFSDFHADRLYAILCRKQNCFRARLTPKPYRAKYQQLKNVFPKTPEEQSALDAWLPGYEAISRKFSVCRYVQSFGPSTLHSAAIQFHDKSTRAFDSFPLA